MEVVLSIKESSLLLRMYILTKYGDKIQRMSRPIAEGSKKAKNAKKPEDAKKEPDGAKKEPERKLKVMRAAIKDFVKDTVTNSEELKCIIRYSSIDKDKICNSDVYEKWENFLNDKDEKEQLKDDSLKAMFIAFKVPGFKQFLTTDPKALPESPSTLEDTPKYFIGFYYKSFRFEFRKCLLQLYTNGDVYLYYIEKDEEKEQIRKAYKGILINGRSIDLIDTRNENKYAKIILSDDINSNPKGTSASWIKEHEPFLGKRYETKLSVIFKEVDNEKLALFLNNIDETTDVISNNEVLDAINEVSNPPLNKLLKISSHRLDSKPFVVTKRGEELSLEKDQCLSNLIGKYELYQLLRDSEQFSCFNLQITDNLEFLLYTSDGHIKFGTIIEGREDRTIILYFPPTTLSKYDFMIISFCLPADHSENKNTMSGYLLETNGGTPFGNAIYLRKCDNPVRRRITFEQVSTEIHNNNEYPEFIQFFIGKSNVYKNTFSPQNISKLEKILNK